MMGKLLFSIPDSEFIRVVNFVFLETIGIHNDWCYNDFVIETAYGVPGGCIWNGNREVLPTKMGISEIKEIFQLYDSLSVKYRLTFTNFLLKQQHLLDKRANEIASELNMRNGFCMVSLPMMYRYVEERYQNLILSWSTTTDFGKSKKEKTKKINDLSKYNLVVPSYDLNRNAFDEWKYPGNLEFLVNEGCVDNCPKRREHEIISCKYNLGEIKEPIGMKCLLDVCGIEPIDSHLDGFIGRKKLYEYVEHGINHFKISGRNSITQALAAYLYFMVYPERWIECIMEIYKTKIFDNIFSFDSGQRIDNLHFINVIMNELRTLVHFGGMTR